MRNLKLIGYGLGGLIILLAVILLAVLLLVNPNDFKGRIATQVKAATGRDLVLQGDIKLSVFPWIALEFGPASLGNPPGFGTEPFLALRRAALRVRLLPLLHKELQVGRIEVDGLDLRLKTNAAGKGNWEDFGQSNRAASATGESSAPALLQNLGGIVIKDSRISDAQMTVSRLNLDVGRVAQRTAVPVQLSLELDTGPAGNQTSVKGALEVKLDQAAHRYSLANLVLSGDLKRPAGAPSLPWKFSAPAMDTDLSAQTLKAPQFTAQLGVARLSGTLSGDKLLDAPTYSGSVKLEPLALREYVSQLGIELPKTRDAKALSMLAASGTFSYALKAWRLQQLDLRLDDTQLRGSMAITTLPTNAISFDLNVDHIDLDRYRAPRTTMARAASAQPSHQSTPLPRDAVRSLDLDGNFSIASAKFADMRLANLRLALKAAHGLVHLFPVKANLYGGDYSGDITYDARGAAPGVKLDQKLGGVDVAALLKDAVGSDRLSGRGNLNMQLVGSGLTSDALIQNLNGRMAANLANGAVNGIDLWHEINRAQALLKQQPVPAGNDDRRTKFDTFRMSAEVARGVATTRDLNIASQLLRVTGGGTSNLLTHVIDYHVVATILKAPPSAQGGALAQLTLADIPVEIGGTMADPKVRPDLQGILKSKLRQDLQDTLQNRLQRLINR